MDRLQKNLENISKNMFNIYLSLKYLEGKSDVKTKKIFNDIYRKAFCISKNIQNIQKEVNKKI